MAKKKRKGWKSQAKYRKSFAHCPYCNSSDIEGREITIDSNEASQEVSCSNCMATWIDIYVLKGYQKLEKPQCHQ